MYILYTQKSYMSRDSFIKMQGILLIFQKKYRGQVFPVKCISVFIDFKHGDFFYDKFI